MTGANQANRRTPPATNGPARRLFRAAALVVALAMMWLSFTPPTGAASGLPWDKANHCLGFLVLTVLTGLGWSRLSAARLAAIILAAGIGIELVQGLPAVGRHADVWDVVADMAGFALGWAVLAVGRRRGWPGFRE